MGAGSGQGQEKGKKAKKLFLESSVAEDGIIKSVNLSFFAVWKAMYINHLAAPKGGG